MSEALGTTNAAASSYWQDTTEKLITNFGNRIFTSSNPSFLYGAKPDTLSTSDSEYGVVYGSGDNRRFVVYSEATVDGTSNTDFLTNDDAVLGMSRDQFENGDDARIIYLDPSKFGGTYTNPKVYVKPVDTEGILGLINVMFPELSPCKPYRTDLVDFGDIADKISGTYNNYPDDPRLRGDPDCIVERPFDRDWET